MLPVSDMAGNTIPSIFRSHIAELQLCWKFRSAKGYNVSIVEHKIQKSRWQAQLCVKRDMISAKIEEFQVYVITKIQVLFLKRIAVQTESL